MDGQQTPAQDDAEIKEDSIALEDKLTARDVRREAVAPSIPGFIVGGDAYDSWLVSATDRVTLRDLYDVTGRIEQKLGTLDTKIDRNSERMDGLVETTNHRLDDFTKALALKADKDELLTSWGDRMMNKSYIRWGIGVAFATLVASATLNHWWHIIISWALRLAQG